jgi:hypothetical protein
MVLFLISHAQIGVFQKVITDSVFSKDYRFKQLPNYSIYNALTNITTSGYDLTTPPGTTAQRPTVPASKYILRYNTDSLALEIGNPAQVWKTLAQSSVQTFDTSSISNFGLKVRSQFSASTPLLYNGVTGVISIPVATGTVSGYLSQADWVIFNAKLPDPGSNGLVVRTALGTTASRQFIAGSTNISIVNPTGVSGNPAIDLNDTILLRQLILPFIPANATTADSTLFLNRSTGMLEVRPASSGGGSGTFNKAGGGISFSGDSLFLNQSFTRGLLSGISPISYNSSTGAISITTVPISLGGTNSSTALSNNRVMQSSGGAIVEAAAITAARALISDANGIPIHSIVTATELSYSSGVTSALQTQINGKQPTGNYVTAGTGDVVFTGPGSVAATISSNAVTNAKTAQMAAHTFKGNNTGSTANAIDLTATQLTAELNTFGASLKGLVPAASGSPSSTKYLSEDGTFTTPAGSGGSQTLQQTFDQGSVQTKHDTIFQGHYVLATNGQFSNKDTARVGWTESMLTFGVSIDAGVIPGDPIQKAIWVEQVAASLGLYNNNRATSGTTLINHGGCGLTCDSSMEAKLPTIPVYDQSTRYLLIGNYQVNECSIFNTDSTTWRTHLIAMIDSLHINRSYPLEKIVVLTGTPNPSNIACDRNLRLATMHVCAEKGVKCFDSFTHLDADHDNLINDSVHLSIKGQLSLATGLLNSTVLDSVQYVKANVLHVFKAITNFGRTYLRGVDNLGDDSTHGTQYIGGTLNLVGDILNATTIRKGLIIRGDADLTPFKWTLYRGSGGGLTQHYGFDLGTYGSGGTLRAFVDGFNGTGFTVDKIDNSDSTIATHIFHVDNINTEILTHLKVTPTSDFNNTVSMNSGLTIKGDNVIDDQKWLIYRGDGGGLHLRFGMGFSGSGTGALRFFTDGFTGRTFDFGFIDNTDSTTFTRTFRIDNTDLGKIFIPGLATGSTPPTTSGTIKMIVADANGLLSLRDTVAAGTTTTIYNGNGTLVADRNVSSGGFTLRFDGTNNSDTLVSIVNSGTTSTGLYSIGSLIGVDAQSTNIGLRAFGTSTGLIATGQNSEGAVISSNSMRGAKIYSTPSSTNTIQEVLQLDRSSTGTAANGIGGSLDLVIEDDGHFTPTAGQLIWKWTDATHATRTSQFYITGVNSGSLATIMTLDGNGNATFGTTNSIVGTATNNNAVVGNIGEEVNSTISTYTNYTTTATYQNITSITLTAGDWDLSAFFTYNSNSATITAASNAIFVVSTTTASASGATEGQNISYVPQAALLGTSKFSDAIPSYRVSLSGTTTYYLNTQSSFTVGNPQFVGSIRARRVR